MNHTMKSFHQPEVKWEPGSGQLVTIFNGHNGAGSQLMPFSKNCYTGQTTACGSARATDRLLWGSRQHPQGFCYEGKEVGQGTGVPGSGPSLDWVQRLCWGIRPHIIVLTAMQPTYPSEAHQGCMLGLCSLQALWDLGKRPVPTPVTSTVKQRADTASHLPEDIGSCFPPTVHFHSHSEGGENRPLR